MTKRFPFAFAPAYRASELPFAITPARAWVAVSATHFDARFGPWRVSTPLANVRGAEITGPYRFIKTAGPARLAITDRGLTFATNGKHGVRVDFHEPVRGLDPLGLLRHPELTVTIEDLEGLIRALV
jgi:hypothetical protein